MFLSLDTKETDSCLFGIINQCHLPNGMSDFSCPLAAGYIGQLLIQYSIHLKNNMISGQLSVSGEFG